jgi:uncharacterized protein (TIGR00725 family)
MPRRAVIAVVGGGQHHVAPGSPAYDLAAAVGQRIARRGGILLCGGGTGVMEAAARGAHDAGGRTVGIMKESAGGAKKHLHLMVWTGLGEARNYVNAAAADAMIALAGEAGTLSEIALGLKLQKPVLCLKAWDFLIPAGFPIQWHADSATAVAAAFAAAGADAAGFVEAAIAYPLLPDQSEHARQFASAVQACSDAGPAHRH